MKKIILMGFPNHRNLGDQAIALAEEKFIRKHFPEYDFHSVPEGIMLKCVEKVRKACSDDDILVLHGGGNFGNQYMYIEDILTEREDVGAFLNVGNNGTVKILGTRSFDLHSEEITVSCEELANWIFIPNKIHIDF